VATRWNNLLSVIRVGNERLSAVGMGMVAPSDKNCLGNLRFCSAFAAIVYSVGLLKEIFKMEKQ